MQGIILAAGRGERMMPYTANTPKPMLIINNKPIIQYNIDILSSFVNKIYIVVGYLGNQIIEYFGCSYNNCSIKYIKQKELLGTADGLWLCRNNINDKFIVMMGDDIYSKKDVDECIKHRYSALAYEMEGDRFGGYEVDQYNYMIRIIKPPKGENYLASTALYVLDKRIFNYSPKQIDGGEYGLPQTVEKMSQDVKIKVVKATSWFPVGYPEDIKNVEYQFRE